MLDLLVFDEEKARPYKSSSQKVRIMSEDWFSHFMYCPVCGERKLEKFGNNSPVSDFFCPVCEETFELKSKGTSIGKKIAGGAYFSTLERVKENNNPNLFVLQYKENRVVNLIFIPKFFFTEEVIEKRPPLSLKAKRAGWIGCNILFDKILDQGKIYVIKESAILKKEDIMTKYQDLNKFYFEDLKRRGWIFDVLDCINRIKNEKFSLSDIYFYQDYLSSIHPKNNNIQAKIRQQLQILRDKNIIRFLGKGFYQKMPS